MNAMDRCEKHKLMRCAICLRADSAPQVQATSAAPGEVLDGPGAPAESAAIVDKQAQEAIERNKAIAAASQVPVAADPTVIPESIPGQSSEPASNFRPLPRHEESPVSTNPIVAAAAEYTEAQKRVETAAQAIKRIRIELDDAENEQKEAISVRDVKKQVLQKLVAE